MLYSDNLLPTTLHKQNSGIILREKNHGKSKLSEAILTWHNLRQHLPLANAVHQSLCSVSWGYWHVSATLKPHSMMITSYSSLQPKDEIATLSKIPNMNSLTSWLFTKLFGYKRPYLINKECCHNARRRNFRCLSFVLLAFLCSFRHAFHSYFVLFCSAFVPKNVRWH